MVRQLFSRGRPGTILDSNFDWEVIVVDDASPDGTQEIAKQLAHVYGVDRVVRIFMFTHRFHEANHLHLHLHRY